MARPKVKQQAAPDLSYIIEGLRPLAVPIESVLPDSENARRHPARNLTVLQSSLRRYGQRKPIIINRSAKIIEAGNGVWLAMKANNCAFIAAVFVEDDPLTAAGFALVDNRSNELSDWDYETLATQLKALDKADFPIAELGWADKELEGVFEKATPAEASGPPEEFPLFDEDVRCDFKCPKCGYEWSGKQK